MKPLIIQVCLLALFTATGLAQSNTLEVQCLDSEGKPLQDVQVLLQGIGSGEVVAEKSNKRGSARFEKLRDDVYRVMGRVEGFDPTYREFLHLQGGKKETVQLSFSPGDSQKRLYFEDQSQLERSNQLLYEGAQALRNRKFEEAESKLKESLEINPSNPDTRQNLALLYLQTGRIGEAEVHLRRSAELLKVFLAISEAESAEQLRLRYEETLRLLDSLPILELESQASAAMEQQNYELAISKYQEMIQLDASNPNLYYNLALAQARAEQLEAARASVEKAIAMKPDEEAFTDLRARIDELERTRETRLAEQKVAQLQELYEKEQYQEVVEKAEALRASLPADFLPSVWVLQARAHARLKQPEDAVRAYRQAIELAPDKAEFRKELAEYAFQQELYAQGIDAYIAWFQAESKPVDEGLLELGKTLISQGKKETAGEIFRRILQINSQFAEAYYELGMYTFYEEKDRDRARELLKKYVELGNQEDHIGNAQSVLAVIESRKR